MWKKVNKTMSIFLPVFWVLYLTQQNNVLCFFFNLKFENVLFTNTLFSCSILHSKGIVYTAKKVQIKYFVKDLLVKISFFYVRTATWICCYCHILCFWCLKKDLFREQQVLEIYYTATDHHSRLNTSSADKKTEPV